MKTNKLKVKRKIMIQDFKRRKKAMNNELPKTKIDERTGIEYHIGGDYYIPNLSMPKQEEITLNKYGRMRLKYLKEHTQGPRTKKGPQLSNKPHRHRESTHKKNLYRRHGTRRRAERANRQPETLNLRI